MAQAVELGQGLQDLGLGSDGDVELTAGNAAEGIETRVIDIRWLAPLSVEAILAALEGAERVLVVDECRESGNVSEALMTLLSERRGDMPCARLAARDSFIATGPAYAATMPSRESIVAAARALGGGA